MLATPRRSGAECPRGATRRCVLGLLLLGIAAVSCASQTTPPVTGGMEVIDLSPDTSKTWSSRHLTAPILALFRGPAYVYAPRRVEVETTPAGGYLDLFYVRSGFQKRFEQAEAPVVVLLPSRLEAGARDAFTVRAFAEGYQPKSVTLKLSERFDQVALDLEPLPNSLETISHRYFAGRSSIGFLTSEALTFRLQESDDGYAVILNETAYGDSAQTSIDELRSPLIEEAYGQQLGQDLMIKFVLKQRYQNGVVEVRSRQRYDAPRDLHEFVIDFVPRDTTATSIESALKALAAIRPSDVSGCALVFDDALRAELDRGQLARALRPRGERTDRYQRAAMRRLGEVSVDGVVDFSDGTQLQTSHAIELEMAIANASMAQGYLALLRQFVAALEPNAEYQQAALKSLIAPELSDAAFDLALQRAKAAETRCQAAG